MKPNYGNWISVSMMKTLCAIAAVLYVLTLGCALFFSTEASFYILAILSGAATFVVIYMYYCRRVFSFEGGGLMRRIHSYLLDQLPWDGSGTALDIGCGSGALTIAVAKKFPLAQVQGQQLVPEAASHHNVHAQVDLVQEQHGTVAGQGQDGVQGAALAQGHA